jgi:ATP-dependent DNA helicase RecG
MEIKGIGNRNLGLLSKLGITNSHDLLTYYPFRYDIIKRSDINSLNQDDKIIIDGIIENIPSVFHFNRKMNKMNFRLNVGTNLVNIVIFNRGFLKNKLIPGIGITVIGKYDKKHNIIVASDLRFSMITQEEQIEGVYHSTYGLTSKKIKTFIDEILEDPIELKSYLPEYLVDKYNFLDYEHCIRTVHNPYSLDNLKKARTRLKYEELFLFMLKMNYLKLNKDKQLGLKRNVEYKEVEKFIDGLPFKLTIDQNESVIQIYKDLIDEKRMNRLLQGDVGSGKTIVAVISMYINYLSGYQSALMAPTEVLASQHFINITKLFTKYGINVALLTGKLKAKEKKEIYNNLNNGNIDIIIGTHALITEEVSYNNLGLVITDEQHRFGVNQRGNLKNKGLKPDILYMSATPIPRTYALTLYGDMDISSIKTMPNGRKEIITLLKSEKEIKEVLQMMFTELKKGHQVYVISPLIEESDKIDLENTDELEKKMNKAFGKLYNIGVLHGKMKANEKEEVMAKFKNGDIQILISTTVIEVGVDVPNATMMVIFDSYRFGLSTLHQLRGRVGRNDLQSYCILISNKETERLNVLTETNDGFLISEEDFKLRGSGDLFGNKQSGDMSFGIADIKRDFNILLKAKEDSLEFLNSQEYVNNKNYDYIRNLIESATNLD